MWVDNDGIWKSGYAMHPKSASGHTKPNWYGTIATSLFDGKNQQAQYNLIIR